MDNETTVKPVLSQEELSAAINEAYLNKRGWIQCSTEFGQVEFAAVCVEWKFDAHQVFLLDVIPVGGFGKMSVPLSQFRSMAKLPDHSGINRIGVGRMAY